MIEGIEIKCVHFNLNQIAVINSQINGGAPAVAKQARCKARLVGPKPMHEKSNMSRNAYLKDLAQLSDAVYALSVELELELVDDLLEAVSPVCHFF